MNKRGKLLGRGSSGEPDRRVKTSNSDSDEHQPAVEINPEYQKIVDYVSSQGKTKEEREALGRVLLSPNAVETYDIMKENGMSSRQIRDAYIHGINDFAHGKRISTAAIYRGIAQRIETLEGYEGVVEEMLDEGIISRRDYKNITSSLNEHKKNSQRVPLNGLESFVTPARKAAAFFLITIGILLSLVAGSPPTAAVIGAYTMPEANIIVGVILLVLGILVLPRR